MDKLNAARKLACVCKLSTHFTGGITQDQKRTHSLRHFLYGGLHNDITREMILSSYARYYKILYIPTYTVRLVVITMGTQFLFSVTSQLGTLLLHNKISSF